MELEELELIITKGRSRLMPSWRNRINVYLFPPALYIVSRMFYRNSNLRMGPRRCIFEILDSLKDKHET